MKTLSKFDGTMLFVSHDRTFLRGIANKVLDLSGDGRTNGESRTSGGGRTNGNGRTNGDGTAPPRPYLYHHPYTTWVERTGHEAPGVRS